MTIVGVIGNERVQSDLRVPNDPIAYVPIAQAPRMQVKLAVRTRGDAMAALPSIREAVRQIDPELALADIRTMEQIWNSSLSGLREPVWLIGIFAALSALLAALGLYGVVSHSVSQQQREIGIRMALGARSSEVLSMVVRSVLTTIAAGLVVRPWRRGRPDARDAEPAVRSVRARSVRVRCRRDRNGPRRFCRRADPGHPRHARRPNYRATVGVG